jgi:hypothetical protein
VIVTADPGLATNPPEQLALENAEGKTKNEVKPVASESTATSPELQ